jgi:hypothetical protein
MCKARPTFWLKGDVKIGLKATLKSEKAAGIAEKPHYIRSGYLNVL